MLGNSSTWMQRLKSNQQWLRSLLESLRALRVPFPSQNEAPLSGAYNSTLNVEVNGAFALHSGFWLQEICAQLQRCKLSNKRRSRLLYVEKLCFRVPAIVSFGRILLLPRSSARNLQGSGEG